MHLEHEAGSSIAYIERVHDLQLHTPFARFARQTAVVFHPIDCHIRTLFRSVGYIGCDNDRVVDWGGALIKYECIFNQVTLATVPGWHAAIPNFPVAYQRALQSLSR